MAPGTPLRDAATLAKRFAVWHRRLVTAEKDGDIAYVGSDWNEGISPWEFGTACQPQRGGAAAARHGLHRSRRVSPR